MRFFLKLLSFVVGLVFLIFFMSSSVNAQCTTSSYQCCWGACSSGYRQVSSGGTTCCATAGGCTADCVCGHSCIVGKGTCTNCVNCERICNCGCNSCSPSPCPSGSSGTNTGAPCRFTYGNRNCGYWCNPTGCGGPLNCPSGSRVCYWHENNPAPTAPAAINFKIGDRSCDLENNMRVPYPYFSSGDGFLARGSTNRRAGDTRGLSPLLRYRYRIPDLGVSSNNLSTSTRYRPSIADLVSEGGLYTIYARANSVNRCSGNRDGPEISRSFRINNIPEVISITPLPSTSGADSNPNLSVSGNPNYDGSAYFDCEVDNPKTFEVIFEDKDGCGDLWTGVSPSSSICGSPSTPTLSLRAVSVDDGRIFVNPVSPVPGSISCDSSTNQIRAEFVLDFGRTSSGYMEVTENLNLQARAQDILGDTSGWVTKRTWGYDGVQPRFPVFEAIEVISASEFYVNWEIEDRIRGLSGVRAMRMSIMLTPGDILRNVEDYGPVRYYPFDDSEPVILEVQDNFREYLKVYERLHGAIGARNFFPRYPDFGVAEDIVDIGKNQDGQFRFKLESVDRACNYRESSEAFLEMGSAWIATRGGLVHSEGGVDLQTKKVQYSSIIPGSFGPDEYTSLSTELLTINDDLVTNYGDVTYLYDLKNYQKRLLNQSWYSILLERVQGKYPNGEMWTKVSSSDTGPMVLGLEELSKCIESQHVYFIEGSLLILSEQRNDYETLASGGVDGCIFIIRDDLIISEGRYESAGSESPNYDLVRGFFVVDGEINIEFVDKGRNVRDGLKVVGGLFATGGEKSVRLGRSLQLEDNFKYPTLIIFHDPRYLDIGRVVLGDTFGGGYIRDVGFIE